jgi:hypothetical protein
MRFLVLLLGLYLVGLAPAGAGAETLSQSLSIVLHGDGAQATRLPSYDPAAPITMSVTDDDEQQIDALSVVAAGPNGASVKVPLIRSAGGAFSGTLKLSEQGMWSLRVISRSGPLSTGTTPVTLAVEAPPPSNAGWIGWAVGLGVFVVVGGGGFFILRRAFRVPASGAAASGAPASSEPATPATRPSDFAAVD